MPFEIKPHFLEEFRTGLTGEVLKMNIVDLLLLPLLELTKDKYLTVKFEDPLTEILKEVTQLDIDALELLWVGAREGLEPERESLEGRLVHRATLTAGSSTELPAFRSVWAFALLKEATRSLKADGLLAPFAPSELEPTVEIPPLPSIVHWRVARDNPNTVECELDGSLMDVDCFEDEDQTNQFMWFTMTQASSFGITLTLERRIYLDPEKTRFDRKVIAQERIREINKPGDENSRDRAIIVEFGKQQSEADYYSLALELWLLGWELATNSIELFMGLRKGVYVNNLWLLSDPITNYRAKGPGPYPFAVDIAWGDEEYPKVYAGRTVEAIQGVVRHNEKIRFG